MAKTNFMGFAGRLGLLLAAFQFLGCHLLSGAEDLRGVLVYLAPATGALYGNALDVNNNATTLQVKVCWDDATFKNNCDQLVAANTLAYASPKCGERGCHDFGYVPPNGPVGNVTPRDGNAHLIYAKIVSPTGGPDKILDGSPWPYTFRNGAVAPMWAPNLESSPARLTASQLAVFANDQDPYSVGLSGAVVCTVNGTAVKDDGIVGYYARKRGVPCANIFVVSIPLTGAKQSDFYISQAKLESTVLAARLPATIQAIALGWVQPAQVSPTVGRDGPRSISAVVANGGWMTGSDCGYAAPYLLLAKADNPYFNSASKAPFTDHHLRPTMLLAGEICPACTANNNLYIGPWLADVATAKATVDAAVAATDSNPVGGNVYWSLTSDPARRPTALVVSPLSLGNQLSPRVSASILGTLASPNANDITAKNILMYAQGAANWKYSGSTFLPGAGVGFSVTSTSGFLPYDGNQTNASTWLRAGAVAAFGSAIEPCSLFIYKHPDPVIFTANYLQGQTVVEALWKSVKQPWSGNFVGDPLASPFSLASPQPTGPKAAIGKIVNGASFVPGSVSPGVVVSVFGSNLGPTQAAILQLDESGKVSTTLGGTRVLVNGSPAPMLYAQSDQINAVVPFTTDPNTSAQLVVETNGVTSAAEALSVVDTSPGVFVVVNQTGDINGPDAPAPKSSIVVLYATGGGATNPPSLDGDVVKAPLPKLVQPVTVTIGGQQAALNYAGPAPGLVAGLLQVNAVVPANAQAGDQPMVLQIGAASTQRSISVAVQ